jgi:hypothetical protein
MPQQLATAPEDNPRRRRRGRRGRRRRNPSNPSGVTIAMITAASAVAVGATLGYVVYRRRKKKVLPPPPDNGGKKPGGGGGGGGGGGAKACNYVDCHIALQGIGQDASPFSWPHKDRWPNNRQLGVQLEAMGYDVGNVNAGDWNMVRKTAMDATQGFQHDYNIVRAAAASMKLSPAPTAGNLATDGLFGASTANAMYDASIWMVTKPWQQIVDEASALA